MQFEHKKEKKKEKKEEPRISFDFWKMYILVLDLSCGQFSSPFLKQKINHIRKVSKHFSELTLSTQKQSPTSKTACIYPLLLLITVC